MSKGRSAGSDNLDERVGVFDFVGVLFGERVDSSHSVTFRGSGDTRLGRVDIVVKTVEQSDDNLSRQTDEEEVLHVLDLVNLSGAHWVVAKSAHSPAKRATLLLELCMQPAVALLLELAVGELRLLHIGAGQWGRVKVLFGHFGDGNIGTRRVWVDLALVVISTVGVGRRCNGLGCVLFCLNNAVVWDGGLGSIGWGRAREEERTEEDVVGLKCVVLLDDLGMHVGHKEEGRERRKTSTGTKADCGNIRRWTLIEAEGWRSLVNNGQSTDGSRDEEEEGRGVD